MTIKNLSLESKKKSKKRYSVQLRLTEEMLGEWKSFVESNSELTSVSNLIRAATNQYILFGQKYAEFQGSYTFQKIHADNWKNFYRVRSLEANLKEYLRELDIDKRSIAHDLQDLQFFHNMSNLITQKICEKINEGEEIKELGYKVKKRKVKA